MLVVIPFTIAVDGRGEDAIDVVKDLVEGVEDGVGLNVPIAFRECEGIEVVGHVRASVVVRRKESVDLLEVDEGARLLGSGWDSTTDAKAVAIIDRDCVAIDLAT